MLRQLWRNSSTFSPTKQRELSGGNRAFALSWLGLADKNLWISERWDQPAIFANLVVDGESRSRFIDSVSKKINF
jgi:hypothetical protein